MHTIAKRQFCIEFEKKIRKLLICIEKYHFFSCGTLSLEERFGGIKIRRAGVDRLIYYNWYAKGQMSGDSYSSTRRTHSAFCFTLLIGMFLLVAVPLLHTFVVQAVCTTVYLVSTLLCLPQPN